MLNFKLLHCFFLTLAVLVSVALCRPVDADDGIINQGNSTYSLSLRSDESELEARKPKKNCLRILCTAEYRGMGCPPDQILKDMLNGYVSSDGVWFKPFEAEMSIDETFPAEMCPPAGCNCRKPVKFVMWRMLEKHRYWANFPSTYNGNEVWFANADCNGIESGATPVAC